MMDAAINTLKVDPTNETALSIKEGTILKDADTDWYKLLSQKASTNSVELSVRGRKFKTEIFYFLRDEFPKWSIERMT